MSMKNVTQLIVRTTELLEAEGRAARDAVRAETRELRRQAGRFVFSTTFLLVGTPLLFAGLGLCAAGMYFALVPLISEAASLAATGVALLLISGGLLWTYYHQNMQ